MEKQCSLKSHTMGNSISIPQLFQVANLIVCIEYTWGPPVFYFRTLKSKIERHDTRNTWRKSTHFSEYLACSEHWLYKLGSERHSTVYRMDILKMDASWHLHAVINRHGRFSSPVSQAGLLFLSWKRGATFFQLTCHRLKFLSFLTYC